MKVVRRHPEVLDAVRYDGTNAEEVEGFVAARWHGRVSVEEVDGTFLDIHFEADGMRDEYLIVEIGSWFVCDGGRLHGLTAEKFREEYVEQEGVKCPGKRSFMTPCVAEDGDVARSDDGRCVGCGIAKAGGGD